MKMQERIREYEGVVITEHFHKVDGDKCWHDIEITHLGDSELWVCVACRNPCIVISSDVPVGCKMDKKYGNSRWEVGLDVCENIKMNNID